MSKKTETELQVNMPTLNSFAVIKANADGRKVCLACRQEAKRKGLK